MLSSPFPCICLLVCFGLTEVCNYFEYFTLQKGVSDVTSIASSDASEGSASATLLSSHAMRMGLYTINLGTKVGQRLHTGHMLILPLIPVFILLAQNTSSFLRYVANANEILTVQRQVLFKLCLIEQNIMINTNLE